MACRLAIELAAARAQTLGLDGILTGLDDRLRLLSRHSGPVHLGERRQARVPAICPELELPAPRYGGGRHVQTGGGLRGFF